MCPVRALKTSEDGDTGKRGGSTALSRRALITLIALSTQIGGVALARNTSGANSHPFSLTLKLLFIHISTIQWRFVMH